MLERHRAVVRKVLLDEHMAIEATHLGNVVANGVNLAGTHGRSAEFGHLCVEPDGRPCSCGKRGCLETYCSAQVLSSAGSGSVDGFFSRLEAGDERARQIWGSYAAHLARAIHDICMVLDGDIVLGGTVASHLEAHLDDLRERVGELDPFDPGASYLKVSRHPLDAVPLGAALTLVARFFGDA